MKLDVRHEINMRRERARQIENHVLEHATEMDDQSLKFWTACAKYQRDLASTLAKLSPDGRDLGIYSGLGRPPKDADEGAA